MEPRTQHQCVTQASNPIANILKCLMNGEIQPTIDQRLQHIWTSLKITIGNLLIRGYRIFKYMLEQQSIIFIKKEQYNTVYLFFKVALKCQQPIPGLFYQNIGHCVGQINKFKKKQMQKYYILILYALDYSTLQITSFNGLSQVFKIQTPKNKLQLLKHIPQGLYNQQCFAPSYTNNDQILIKQNQEEHKRLKQILYSYIDTFGQKYKTNFYKDLSKKSQYLINTLNLIVFQETKPISKPGECTPVYNQIQSACWTLFKTGRLDPDRKDIVFSGNGRILFVDLIFNYNFNAYLSEDYRQQVNDLLEQCKASYSQAKIKVIKIENSLTPRHVYSYHSQIIRQFSKTPIYS